jgi:hypothetical protein
MDGRSAGTIARTELKQTMTSSHNTDRKNIMPQKSTYPTTADHSQQCLQYLVRCGGSARLSSIKFSLGVIQTLVNQKLVKINNTGAGFYVELEDAK